MNASDKKLLRAALRIHRNELQNCINGIDVHIGTLFHDFTKKDINDAGYEYDEFYVPGNEHLYKNGNRNIRVPKDGSFSYILTYGGHQTRQIEDLEDLKEYTSTGK